MRAARVVLELARAHGIDRVFGNPGTTEMPLMDELVDTDLTFTLALHESAAVAMADGYARARHQPSFVLLHIAAGLANGVVTLLDAKASRTPLVVVAGQQDSRHLDQDPMLAGDLVAIARPACKSAVEVHRAEDIEPVIRRAFAVAMTPPEGPTFVSLPLDLLDHDIAAPGRIPARPARLGAASGLDAAARLLRKAKRPLVIAGDGIAREDAMAEAVAVAEALRAPVYQSPMFDAVNFPSSHPLCLGFLPPDNELIYRVLTGHDVVFIVGHQAFRPHYFTQTRAVPDDVLLVQLDADPGTVGRNYPVEVGLVGGVRATLRALADLLADGRLDDTTNALARVGAVQRDALNLIEPARRNGRMTTPAAMRALAAALPPDAIVVAEPISADFHLRRFLRVERPGSFHHTVGGGLGWGLGAAIGVQIAEPDRPVVAVVGDGSATFGIQALWTAAHLGTPAIFVVINNGEYRVLKDGLDKAHGTVLQRRTYLGMTLGAPALKWKQLADGFGVRSTRVTAEEELSRALGSAVESGEPILVDLVVAPREDPPISRFSRKKGKKVPELMLEPNVWSGNLFLGEWVSMNGSVMDVVEPATGKVLGVSGLATAQTVRSACETAQRAHPAWAQASYEERAAVLRNAADLIDTHQDELTDWLVRESGSVRPKVAFELMASRSELLEAAALTSQSIGKLLPSPIAGRLSFARRVPFGVVGVITPWNFPMLLALRSVAPALALGNAVVLKPDVGTAVSGGFALARIFELAGLPPGVLCVVPGGAEAGRALVTDPDTPLITFTGSTAVGREVGRLAGEQLKKVSLELGGNSALIVLEDADIEAASSAGAWGSFLHQGQICMATSRHLVHERIAEEYTEAITRRAQALKMGDPFTNSDAAIGPLINTRQADRVEKLVQDTVQAGATLRTGGVREGNLYQPTVLTEVAPEMRAFREEIFGPIAPITSFSSEDEAVELANATDYGLATAIQTRSVERGLAMSSRIRSGMVHVNDQTVNDEAHIPMGGMGSSGNGSRFGGEFNLEEFTQWQWVTARGHGNQFPF
jgi:benzaldehyde dehydrogenase (NAD)